MIWKCCSSKIISLSAVSSGFEFAALASRFSSTLNSSASSHFDRSRHVDVNSVKVFVWWDFENCQIPVGSNALKVAQTITAAIRANGIYGPVHINAFGDVFQLSRPNQVALTSTGVNMHHIPRDGRNCTDRFLIEDLMYWVSQNPPPAHLFLISGDSDFASLLHRLRMQNYNVLLACTDTAAPVLCSAASIMWQWNVLIKEEKYMGKLFNQPPGDPQNSWYGHHKLPLDNPFMIEHNRSESEDSSIETPEVKNCLAPKVSSVPHEVVQQIRQILNLYQGKISLNQLRQELQRLNVELDKDYFGHKKFINFILSMPQFMSVHDSANGYVVKKVSRKVRSPVHEVSNKCDGVDSSSIVEQDSKPETSDSLKMKDAKSGLLPIKEQSVSNRGSLKMIWERSPSLHAEREKENEKGLGRSGVSAKEITLKIQSNNSLENDKLLTDGNSSIKANTDLQSETNDTCEKDPKEMVDQGILSKILRWLRIWPRKSDEQRQEEPLSINEGIFMQNTFWKEVEDFILSPAGSDLIMHSITRKDIAQKLRNEGPQATRLLNEHEALKLVDLLISEKKLLVESPSDTQLFKVAHPAQSSSDKKNNSNGHEKSRSVVLNDCKKLLDEVFKEFPEGYQACSFKPLFFEKYGYELDIQRLGYNKLSSLFLIMPGVQLKSNMIYPYKPSSQDISNEKNSNISSPGSSENMDKCDLLWEELGPVDDSNDGKKKPNGDTGVKYEPSTSDDIFSDSESETENSCSSAQSNPSESRGNEENSSLIQILDSWYRLKENDPRVDLCDDKVQQSNTRVESQGRQEHVRLQKPYSFVVDAATDGKEQIIDDILHTLKKKSDDVRTPLL